MPEMPTISRKNQHIECSQIVGRLNVKLSDGSLEFIAVPCTKPKGHHDACEFVGVELVITHRRRDDDRGVLYLPESFRRHE